MYRELFFNVNKAFNMRKHIEKYVYKSHRGVL
jgi:hypothetical protein